METSEQGLKHARSSNENTRTMSITSFWCVEQVFHIILIWCFHYWLWTIEWQLKVWKPANWIKSRILVHFVYWGSAFVPYSIGERCSPYIETIELKICRLANLAGIWWKNLFLKWIISHSSMQIHMQLLISLWNFQWIFK